MGQIKWYKRDPDAALSGMMGLSLEERGAYNTILDLIYARDGHLPDDERFIAGWLGADVRVWRRIRERLIDLGKLTIIEGLVVNFRATSEVDAALARLDAARTAGLESARKRSKFEPELPLFNDLGSTSVPTDAQRNPQPIRITSTTRSSSIEDDRARPKPRRVVSAVPCPDGVPADLWDDFVRHRKAKGGPITPTALKGFEREAAKAGWTLAEAITESIERGWRGFKAEWVKDDDDGNRRGAGRRASPDRRDGFTRAIHGEVFPGGQPPGDD